MNKTTYRAAAFANDKTRTHQVAVDENGTVRVWDDVAGHFTVCHCLTERQQAAIRAKVAKN